MQRRFIAAHARVAADQLQLRHRHIQRGGLGVFQMQKLLQGRAAVRVFRAHIHIDQAAIAPYAVLAVHHGVADIQLGQIADEGV